MSKHSSFQKALRTGLIIALVIVFFQVILGGITRLTKSGLSITKWDLITGTLPPLSEEAWNTEFELYKATPQYEMINKGMNLPEFKYIFFWEWAHRFWGRLGFLYLFVLLIYGAIKWEMKWETKKRFVTLLFLYFMQGVMGIFMVYSGLVDIPYVSHYRLAAHLLLALLLFAYLLWWIADLSVHEDQKVSAPKLHRYLKWVIALVILQIVFGAFMSGLRAAGWYPSWPDMNGQMIPESLFLDDRPLWQNFFNNRTTIQFTHRGLAYMLFVLIIIYWYKAKQLKSTAVFKKSLHIIPVFLCVQIVLGITTLLLSSGDYIPVLWGVLHQMCGLLLLSSLLFSVFLFRK